MHPIEAAIMRTICYADIFDYPQTRLEIYEKLIHPSKVSLSLIDLHLSKLHAGGAICRTGSYYHLPQKAHLVKHRSERSASSAEKSQQAAKVATQLIKLPHVMAIFLTGAVAVGNAPADDDIDLLIVAAPHSLWSCRWWVNVWLDSHRLRRHPGDKNVSNKICPNLFMTADSLAVLPNQRNLYTAHEVVQVKPLIDPFRLHRQFLSTNRWFSRFLANQPGELVHDHSPVAPEFVKRPSPPWLETLTRLLQYAYMYPKKTRETITLNAAYFHPRDTAGIVLAKYKERIRPYKL